MLLHSHLPHHFFRGCCPYKNVISLIGCHHLSLMIRYPTLSFFLICLYTIFLNLFLFPHITSKTFSLVSQVSSWDIITLKKGIDVSLNISIGIVSVGVSFYEFVPYYTTIHYNDDICSHLPTTINLPSSTPNDSTITRDASPKPLQVY